MGHFLGSDELGEALSSNFPADLCGFALEVSHPWVFGVEDEFPHGLLLEGDERLHPVLPYQGRQQMVSRNLEFLFSAISWHLYELEPIKEGG